MRRATKRPAPGDRDDYGYVDRKRSGMPVDLPVGYDPPPPPPPPPRYADDPKAGGGGRFVSADYRGSKGLLGSNDGVRGHGYSRNPFVERPPPSASSASSAPVGITRRIVQEVQGGLRRDGRQLPASPPPPPRERLDDRRVIDRRGDDRYGEYNID